MNARQIKALRRKLGWTQQQLANALGVTSRTVQHWEITGVTARRTIIALKNL